ncbi:MAG: ABC transporter substrate-binding protein [Proteobacteria bacterium]|nr:ABC transporter substrate-binding protein [Pseudomonadota bacterium]
MIITLGEKSPTVTGRRRRAARHGLARRRLLAACGALGLLGQLAYAQEAQKPPIRLGVLTDITSIYTDNSGIGSVTAAQMAVEDFGGSVLGRRIEVLSADHQNKADVGAGLARKWLDVDQVGAIVDVPNSSIALAVQEMTREKGRLFLATGAATSRLTGDACSPTGIHWTYDTYAASQGTARALTRQGGKTWFFITANYAFGAQLEADSQKVIAAEGGTTVGSVRHPVNTADFSSYLLQAQASGAKVIGLANAGGDFIQAVKQAAEFGIARSGQRLAGLLVFVADVHSLGLPTAQGLVLSSAFYWDMDADTRAWSQRFIARVNKVPTMIHAGTYGAVTHYLKAIKAAGTDEGKIVARKMREMPVNDFMTKKGVIREDGRLMRDMYLFEVKKPSESKGRFDYYKRLATIPASEAFKRLDEGGCPLVAKASN